MRKLTALAISIVLIFLLLAVAISAYVWISFTLYISRWEMLGF